MEVCSALETCGLCRIFRGRTQGKTKHTTNQVKTTIDVKELEEEASKIGDYTRNGFSRQIPTLGAPTQYKYRPRFTDVHQY